MIRTADRAGAREAGYLAPKTTDSERVPAASDALAALDALGEDDREVLILKHAAGLSFDQIALALEQNRNTVASRYRRAADFLRSRADTLTPEAHLV